MGRVVYGIGGVLCAFFGLVLWLAFYDAKTRASVYVLMLLLATFPLAIAALLFARARTAHLAIRRPTDEAMRAVLAQAYASDARVAPGEIAARSGVPIVDAAQALDALTAAGAARRETTAEGYVVYTVARSRGAA